MYMFNYICVIDTALEIHWVSITSVISIIGFIVMIVVSWGKKLSKTTYYIHEEKRDQQIKELENKIMGEIKTKDEQNTASHLRLEHETERYYGILEKQIEVGREETNKKLDLLLEIARKNSK